ncbi:hypothetical protein LZZ85_03140 [Terrimonas sp. NA20]|uniref:G8 domain-containing protein n=1 Tax=Terrimonas ginsenosidimutans TaxID=2908004 RepID=A0ABS9KLQ5_9BACT|nr:hypothetical protein [Terrimonas ginsenosidimutans]MCG2613253.1 hypothetical protein [Terrimonas ginsenosidimutans]
MKKAILALLFTGIVLVPAFQVFAQDAYRTHTAGKVSQWTDVAIWQRYDPDQKAWLSAERFPASADGVITIQTGDSVIISGIAAARLSIDQVVIDQNASLVLMQNENSAVKLNDGDGDDITIRGRMYIGAEGMLRGEGKIQVTETGVFSLRDNGLLSASLSNNGTIHLGGQGNGAGSFAACQIVNNKTCRWIDGQLMMDSATVFTNNGLFQINAVAGDLICNGNKKHPARIINKGAIINVGKEHVVEFRVKVENSGTIGGVGTFVFSGGANSGGVISPGASPGHLTLGKGIPASPVINIEIATTGAVAGVNYDQLTVPSLSDLADATINVTNTAADSVNTEYTIINAKALQLEKGKSYPQLTVHAPSNFSYSFKGNRLVLVKIAKDPLEITWGGFRAFANGKDVMLHWNTVADTRTSHFLIEHSTDGVTYNQVNKVEVKRGATGEVNYDLTFTGADLFRTNYFRVKQVNKDGRTGCSVARSVRYDRGTVSSFQFDTNLENEELLLNIQAKNVTAAITDITGKSLHEFALQPGQHSVYVEILPAGAYRFNFYVKGVMVETKQFVKY